MSGGPVGILITREVIVDGELSVEDGGALTALDSVSLCSTEHVDTRLTRSYTV